MAQGSADISCSDPINKPVCGAVSLSIVPVEFVLDQCLRMTEPSSCSERSEAMIEECVFMVERSPMPLLPRADSYRILCAKGKGR